MFKRSLQISLIVLPFVLAGLAPSSARDRTPLADPAAERVAKMFDRMEAREQAREKQKRTYELSEGDLNAYLAAKIKERDRKDVERLAVQMGDGRFTTELRVDMDHVEIQGDSMTKALVKALLRGKQTMEVEGRLETDNGKATYHVESATMNGLPLPPVLVNVILSSVGSRQDPPFDPTEPFDLPLGIKTVQVRTDKTTIQAAPGE